MAGSAERNRISSRTVFSGLVGGIHSTNFRKKACTCGLCEAIATVVIFVGQYMSRSTEHHVYAESWCYPTFCHQGYSSCAVLCEPARKSLACLCGKQ